MLYNDTVTLFNRKPGGAKGDTWYPTVIRGVFLRIDRAAMLAKYGAESQDGAMLHIRYQVYDGVITVAGKPYMLPKEWDKTVDSITFSPGDKFDFFWKGEWIGGIVSDTDFGDEGFYDHMNRTRDNVFAISEVSKKKLIPHFEILGR